jgi:mannosyltransferase OCH1-like enzyme
MRAIKAKRHIPLQTEIAEKLDTYIADFLSGKIERFSAIPKKPELVGEKIFWQYWHQGINDGMPKIVISCLNSVKKHSNGYEIIMLTDKNVNDYIDLPDFVFEKFKKGGYSFAKLSNLVRLYLLSAYGGVWLDATIYLTKPIEESLLQKDFFAFQRSKTPPPDANIYIKYDPLYFSWSSTFQVKMLNSFMIAKPNNKIIADLLTILLEYWRKEAKTRHYFFFQICFNRMTQRDEWKNLNCEIIGDTDCHKFQTVALDKFDYRIYKEIVAKSDIHKLTYRFDRFGQISAGSFFDVLANGNLEQEKI